MPNSQVGEEECGNRRFLTFFAKFPNHKAKEAHFQTLPLTHTTFLSTKPAVKRALNSNVGQNGQTLIEKSPRKSSCDQYDPNYF